MSQTSQTQVSDKKDTAEGKTLLVDKDTLKNTLNSIDKIQDSIEALKRKLNIDRQ